MTYLIRISKMTEHLPGDYEGRSMAEDIFQSASRAVILHRHTRIASSREEFTGYIGGACSKLYETSVLLEMIIALNLLPAEKLTALQQETEELLRILEKSRRTAKAGPKVKKTEKP